MVIYMTDRTALWQTVRAPIAEADPHYAACTPDLYVPDPLDISAAVIASLAVKHVFIDFDGTIAARGNMPHATDDMLAHLSRLATDARFETFGIATNNRSRYMGAIAASIGENVKLFQPNDTPNGPIWKSHPGYFRRILFDTDIWDNPELAVMIGDSMVFDIIPAQNAGMKTILVDRIERYFMIG